MGKKRRDDLSKQSKKLLKELMKESKPEPFVIDGKVVYFNPLKRLLEGDAYKTQDGLAVTQDMVYKYEQLLKARMERRKDESES